jgi:hypothetical protein
MLPTNRELKPLSFLSTVPGQRLFCFSIKGRYTQWPKTAQRVAGCAVLADDPDLSDWTRLRAFALLGCPRRAERGTPSLLLEKRKKGQG